MGTNSEAVFVLDVFLCSTVHQTYSIPVCSVDGRVCSPVQADQNTDYTEWTGKSTIPYSECLKFSYFKTIYLYQNFFFYSNGIMTIHFNDNSIL